MRIVTQRIDEITEVCPRLGLVLVGGPFADTKMARLVFPNSPCGRSGLHAHDVVLHINRVRIDDIHRMEFSDRRRSELDFEIWRSFRHYRMSVRVDPEPFAPIAEIFQLSRAFVAKFPLQPITFRNPDFDDLHRLFGRFGGRRRPRSGSFRGGRQ
jgi:hypothetical protein